MELINKNELIKSIELGIKQLEESEKNIVPNELGSPDIVIPCAIMLMKSMIEVVNMCDVIESRPQGKLIEEWDGYRCSNCQMEFSEEIRFLNYKMGMPKFCPNCSAEIVEGENEID